MWTWMHSILLSNNEIARNFAMFANEGGMHDNLLAYIGSHPI